MDLLKRFDRTVDEMHEKMHEFEDCKWVRNEREYDIIIKSE